EPATGDLAGFVHTNPTAGDQDQVEAGGRSRRPLYWKMAVFALLLLLSAAFLVLVPLRTRPSAPIRSLAVLPLENLSGDASQDYFSDGMTDELITELGQISDLRVISRTSVMTYKGVRKSLPEIARDLNV